MYTYIYNIYIVTFHVIRSLLSILLYIALNPTLYVKIPGGRLNKKDGLTRYGDSHVKDKTS